jgi:hypothetical protein
VINLPKRLTLHGDHECSKFVILTIFTTMCTVCIMGGFKICVQHHALHDIQTSIATIWLVKSKLQKSWLLKSVQADLSQLGSIKYMINVINSLV